MKLIPCRLLVLVTGVMMAMQASATITVQAHYRLGETGQGTNKRPIDSSGNARNFDGDSNGSTVAVTSATPAPGSTTNYVFSGSQGFRLSSYTWQPDLNTNFGIECWARAASLNQFGQVFGAGCVSSYGRGMAIVYNNASGFQGA